MNFEIINFLTELVPPKNEILRGSEISLIQNGEVDLYFAEILPEFAPRNSFWRNFATMKWIQKFRLTKFL
jgi:hypothetical protein